MHLLIQALNLTEEVFKPDYLTAQDRTFFNDNNGVNNSNKLIVKLSEIPQQFFLLFSFNSYSFLLWHIRLGEAA